MFEGNVIAVWIMLSGDVIWSKESGTVVREARVQDSDTRE